MNRFILDILSLGAIISGILVITSNNPVISVLFLIAVFINSAGYLIILGVSFIGISYLIVYVGAIAILFLFVVIMLNIQISEIISIGHEYTKNLPLGFIVRLLFLLEIISIIPLNNINEITTNLFNTINRYFLNINNFYYNNNVHLIFNQHDRDNFSNFLQIEAIGQGLYIDWSIWLILCSIILLLAILGPLRLCLRSNKN